MKNLLTFCLLVLTMSLSAQNYFDGFRMTIKLPFIRRK